MRSSEPDSIQPAQQALYMQHVCEAFLAQDALAVIVGLLAEPLSRHPKMTDKDTALVELVITFLRNLLAATEPASGASNIAMEAGKRLKNGLLERLFADDVLDLLLLVAQHARERPFKAQSSILLELFLTLFTDVTAEGLLRADADLSAMQNEIAQAGDLAARKKAILLQQRVRPSAGAMPAPSRDKTIINKGPGRVQYAAAVYMRRHRDHNAGVLVRHAPAQQALSHMDTVTNPKYKKAQTRDSAAGGASRGRGSSASVGVGSIREARLLVSLNSYLNRFLEEAYTPLIGQVFKDARAGLGVSMLEEEDFERFARFVGFCTRYARLREEGRLMARMTAAAAASSSFVAAADVLTEEEREKEADRSPFECISATLGWDSFHMVLVLLQISREREATRQRDKVLNKICRPHILLNSLGPLLREMLLTLDLARVAGNAADQHAADRLQRRLAFDDTKDSGILEIITRCIRDFKFAAHSQAHAVHLVDVLHIVLGMLDRLTSQHGGLVVRQQARQQKRALGGSGGGGDAALKEIVVEEEEKEELDEEEKEKGTTKNDDGAAEAENLSNNVDEEKEQQQQEKESSAKENEADDDQEDRDREQQRSILPQAYKEVQFDLQQRLRKTCAHAAILQFYVWLLQFYASNARFTNTALTSFLTRFATSKERGGLGLESMLWQLSVLRVFHAIMADRAVRADPQHAELLKLCTHVTRSLFKRLVPPLPSPPVGAEDIAPSATAAANEVIDAFGDDEGGDGGEKERAAKEGGEEEEEGLSGEALAAKQMAELEPKMKEKCAALGFIELLFWKTANVAEVVADEYNWKKLIEMKHEGGGGGGGGGGPSNGEGQLGFASYKGASSRAPTFSTEQTAELVAAFERCNGYKDCLTRLVDEFHGDFKKNQISKKMTDLGLYRGKFTYNQQERMRALMEVHADKGPKSKFAAIAEDLGAGFTGNQVKNKLRDLGVVAGGKGGGRGGGGGGGGKSGKASARDAWDALLGSEEESDGDGGKKKKRGSGSDSNDSSSSDSSSDEDSDDGGGGGSGSGGKRKNSTAAVAVPSFDEIMLDREGDDDVSPEAVEEEKENEEEAEIDVEMRDAGDHHLPLGAVEKTKKKKKKERESGSKKKRHANEQEQQQQEEEGPAPKLRRRSDDNGRATAEGDVTEQRRAATLALLRKKHKPATESVAPAPAAAEDAEVEVEIEEEREMEMIAPPAVVAADSDGGGGTQESDQKENMQQQQEVVKTFGGRRLKRVVTETAVVAPLPNIFDDLDDF